MPADGKRSPTHSGKADFAEITPPYKERDGQQQREILGRGIGELEAKEFWINFLGGLCQRGLTGGRLEISDA